MPRRPKFQHVMSVIERRIRQGDYLLNPIPGERKIAEETGGSHITAPKALPGVLDRDALLPHPVPAFMPVIERRIRQGAYLLTPIPGERKMAEETGVSHMTARKAVRGLLDRNVLIRNPRTALRAVMWLTPVSSAIFRSPGMGFSK